MVCQVLGGVGNMTSAPRPTMEKTGLPMLGGPRATVCALVVAIGWKVGRWSRGGGVSCLVRRRVHNQKVYL